MWSRLRSLWRNMVHRRRVDRDLDEEVGTAYELLVSEKERSGLDAQAARRAAAVEFGRVERVVEEIRDVRAGAILDAWSRDFHQAFRLLRRSPGLYGLTSYAVTQRTPEIGLRMALGASPQSISWLAVRESVWTVLLGAVAGLAAAYGVVRIVESQLFGVQPHDPLVFATAVGLLLTMAVAAAFFPARRASRIDPLVALRHE